MKILVVNLLRLGDFIQGIPALNELKTRHPKARLDVLTHKPVQALQTMLPIVSQWWTLNRDELQVGLGDGAIPMLTSFSVLQETLDRINEEKYDLIVNLTHTQYAGWICGYLQSHEKLGLEIDVRGEAHFHSPWFRYLDTRARQPDVDCFNYTDVFAQACGGRVQSTKWPLVTTSTGHQEVKDLNLKRQSTIVIQPFTSDPKKDWSTQAWRELIRKLHTQHQVVVLAAPSEQTRLNDLLAEESASVVKAVLSLDGALALLQQSDLLITGDTSIKHLANAGRARVLELALGSSDPKRTGAHKANSLVLQSRVACSPCPHSSSCSRATHVCSEDIHPDLVEQAVECLLVDDWKSLKRLAQAANVRMLRTHHLKMGFWYAEDLGSELAANTLTCWLERSKWKFLLSLEDRGKVKPYGSESEYLKSELFELHSLKCTEPVLAHLDFLEQSLQSETEQLEFGKMHFLNSRPLTTGPIFELAQIRKRQIALDQRAQESEVLTRLVRSLKTQLMDHR